MRLATLRKLLRVLRPCHCLILLLGCASLSQRVRERVCRKVILAAVCILYTIGQVDLELEPRLGHDLRSTMIIIIIAGATVLRQFCVSRSN